MSSVNTGSTFSARGAVALVADIEYPKLPPEDLVTATLDALEMGEIELLADQFTRQTKAILSDYPCKRPPF